MGINLDRTKKIIIDADVIIHFIRGEQLAVLHTIFENKLYILDYVFKEVFVGKFRVQIENLLTFGFINELAFDADTDVIKEFARLKRRFGSGESACMAYCRYHHDVLASSNLTDIKSYCELHKIQYLTTMDFVYEAFCKGILSKAECDFFIYNVTSKGSRLPYMTIDEYIQKDKKTTQ